MQNKEEVKKPKESTGLTSVVASVAAAFFGVQSDQNRERDFSQGKFSHFVIGGIIGVVLFVATLVLIVNIVLS